MMYDNLENKKIWKRMVNKHVFTNKFGITYYSCTCDCGNVEILNRSAILKPKHCSICEPKIDLSGNVYGIITVVSISHKDNNIWFYNVKCNLCGKMSLLSAKQLKTHNVIQCGCGNTRHNHNMSRTSEYRIWQGLRQRCDNPKATDYFNYGGRGISYDDRWKKFINFYNDMGSRPDGYEIDRIDVNGDYCKENCRWVTRAVNNLNKRKIHTDGIYSTRYIGVRKTKNGRYEVRFRNKYIGSFDTINEAADAYDLAKIAYTKTSHISTNAALIISTDDNYNISRNNDGYIKLIPLNQYDLLVV